MTRILIAATTNHLRRRKAQIISSLNSPDCISDLSSAAAAFKTRTARPARLLQKRQKWVFRARTRNPSNFIHSHTLEGAGLVLRACIRRGGVSSERSPTNYCRASFNAPGFSTSNAHRNRRRRRVKYKIDLKRLGMPTKIQCSVFVRGYIWLVSSWRKSKN